MTSVRQPSPPPPPARGDSAAVDASNSYDASPQVQQVQAQQQDPPKSPPQPTDLTVDVAPSHLPTHDTGSLGPSTSHDVQPTQLNPSPAAIPGLQSTQVGLSAGEVNDSAGAPVTSPEPAQLAPLSSLAGDAVDSLARPYSAIATHNEPPPIAIETTESMTGQPSSHSMPHAISTSHAPSPRVSHTPASLAASIGSIRSIPPWGGGGPIPQNSATPPPQSLASASATAVRAPSAPPTSIGNGDNVHPGPGAAISPEYPASSSHFRTSLSPEIHRNRWAQPSARPSGFHHPPPPPVVPVSLPHIQSRAPSRSPGPQAYASSTSNQPGSAPISRTGSSMGLPSSIYDPSASSATHLANQPSSAGRTLNVKDALSYLDQVKIRFDQEPSVYNKFLDVMKEFKTQSIDTPGVITRVSTLFRGHPSLIQGFNTFLPPGFRIECSTIEGPLATLPGNSVHVSDNNITGLADMITVHSPSGIAGEVEVFVRGAVSPWTHFTLPSGTLPPGWRFLAVPVSPPLSVPASLPPVNENVHAIQNTAIHGLHLGTLPPPQPHLAIPGITPGAARVLGVGLGGTPSPIHGLMHGKQPLEFNHAITYVNRIKSRFTDQPDIYKEFLDILQRYQKDARPIQDVYAQVTILFKEAPDLLDEFKAFLPDPSVSPANSSLPPPLAQPGFIQGFGALANLTAGVSALAPHLTPPTAPVNSASTSSVLKRAAPPPRDPSRTTVPTSDPDPPPPKRKRVAVRASSPKDKDKQLDVTAVAPASAAQLDQVANKPVAKGKKKSRNAAPPPRDVTPDVASMQTYEPAHNHVTPSRLEMVTDLGPVNHVHYNKPPAYVDTHNAMQGRTLVNPCEMAFFDNVKKYLSTKEVYHEFLRVLALFTKKIIDLKTLTERVCVFIGDDDALFEDFKGLIGYDVVKHGLIEEEVWDVKNVPLRERFKLEPSQITGSYGASYKRLPRAERDLACSGRDALCWSVLNDTYFAAAAFGTESGGPMHKKTAFEAVMEACEQERSFYSYWLDAISRTIAHFESIQARIDSMDDTERPHFRLGYHLSGSSPSIYSRVLKKVYDSRYKSEIFPLLEEYSSATVPVVLRRLHEVEQTWKAAEMQWNVVWREVERKNHYRARDHQVQNFKLNDKTLLKSSSLVKELQDLQVEGIQKRQVSNPDIESERPTHQLEVGFEDKDIFFESLYLMSIFLDRTPFAKIERRRVYDATRILFPTLFNLSEEEIETFVPIAYLESSESENDGEEDESEAGTSVIDEGKTVASRNGYQDLHKRLLSAKAAGEAENHSKQTSPVPSSPIEREDEGTTNDVAAAEGVSAEEEAPLDNERQSRVRGSSSGSDTEMSFKPQAVDLGDAFTLGMSMERQWTPIDGHDELRYQCFGSSSVYAVLRTLHILYSRLVHLKSVAEKLKKLDNPPWHRVNPLAIELGMAYVVHGVDDQVRPADHLFPFIIDQIHRYCDHEVEQPIIEEELRVLFPLDGYLLSTLDKLLQGALKSMGTIMAETKSKSLLTLFKNAGHTQQEQDKYRQEAEELAEDVDLFRMEWLPKHRRLTFSLITRNEVPAVPESEVNQPLPAVNETEDDVTATFIPIKIQIENGELKEEETVDVAEVNEDDVDDGAVIVEKDEVTNERVAIQEEVGEDEDGEPVELGEEEEEEVEEAEDEEEVFHGNVVVVGLEKNEVEGCEKEDGEIDGDEIMMDEES